MKSLFQRQQQEMEEEEEEDFDNVLDSYNDDSNENRQSVNGEDVEEDFNEHFNEEPRQQQQVFASAEKTGKIVNSGMSQLQQVQPQQQKQKQPGVILLQQPPTTTRRRSSSASSQGGKGAIGNGGGAQNTSRKLDNFLREHESSSSQSNSSLFLDDLLSSMTSTKENISNSVKQQPAFISKIQTVKTFRLPASTPSPSSPASVSYSTSTTSNVKYQPQTRQQPAQLMRQKESFETFTDLEEEEDLLHSDDDILEEEEDYYSRNYHDSEEEEDLDQEEEEEDLNEVTPRDVAVQNLKEKLDKNQLNNPFIHSTSVQVKGNCDVESMIPAPVKISTIASTASPYQRIIQDAARKQLEAQRIFRNLSLSSASTSASSPTNGNNVTPNLVLERPASPSLYPNRPEIPVRSSTSSPAPSSSTGSSGVGVILPPAFINSSPEQAARMERLASLGIFDVNPRAKVSSPATPSKMQEANNKITALNSFATPHHQKPQQLDRQIREISGPQLVSTSSRVQTVPIKDILRDLKASGRLIEHCDDEEERDFEQEEQPAKKGFFQRKK